MIFRRLKAHIAKEDWFSVCIDFVIVVFGVFMGIQVSNWNQERDNQREYLLALDRLAEEAKTNISTLDEFIGGYTVRIDDVVAGLEALRSCQDNPSNQRLIERGLNGIRGTATLHIRTTAIDELTSSPILLAQQAPDVRRALSTAKFNLSVTKIEADFAESLPLRDRPESNSALSVSDPVLLDLAYYGMNTSGVQYLLKLDRPIKEACNDDRLLKSFYVWHRFQSRIPAYAANMRAEMTKIITTVQKSRLSIK